MATTSKPASRKTGPRPNERVRLRVLETALTLFADRGFYGVTIREIAQRSDVNHAMIKYYFKNKETLWREAVNFLFERADKTLAANINLERVSADSESALEEILSSLVAYSAKHPEHGRLVMRESMHPGPRLDWLAEKGRAQHDALWNTLAAVGCTLDRNDPRFIALIYLINSACQIPFVLSHEIQAMYGLDLSEEAYRSMYTQILRDLVPALNRQLSRF